MQLHLPFVPDFIEDLGPFLSPHGLDHVVMFLYVPKVLLVKPVDLRLVPYVFLFNKFFHGFLEGPSEFLCKLLSHMLSVLLIQNVVLKFVLKFKLQTLVIVCLQFRSKLERKQFLLFREFTLVVRTDICFKLGSQL